MIDVHELLRRKEDEINRVRREIDALHLVAPLLSDSVDGQDLQAYSDSQAAFPALEDPHAVESLQDGAPLNERSPESDENLFESIQPKRSLLRDWFGRAAGE
jgi:hypothetical protein